MTADDDTLSTSSLEAGLRSLSEPDALLLGDPSEDRDPQRADWASGVEARLVHADDVDPAAFEVEDGLEVADHRAPEPIERPDDDDVELPPVGGLHRGVELGASLRGADLLFERGDLAESTGAKLPLDVPRWLSSVCSSLLHPGRTTTAERQRRCEVVSHEYGRHS
ncbi:MAG: hypothetical protein AAGA54_21880 [Myxococcota bacterium]